MSRDNHLQQSSRSRSLSRYRNYNNASKSQQRSSPLRYSRDHSPPSKRSRYQRERSHSYEKKNGHRGRGASPTTTDIRRKNPDPSKVLGVFNLHVRTTENEIRDVFERFGQIDDIIMVKDAKTRGFRGYCFLYFNKQRDATDALNECNGMEMKDRMIRVDYSLSDRPHNSTPGEYRGKRGRNNDRGVNFRPRNYSPMRNERARYYDRQDNDRHRRHRSMDRGMRRFSQTRDDFRSEHHKRRRSRDYEHRRSRSPRERRDRH